MTPWFPIFIGYALGSFQPGYYLTRLVKGSDIRKMGSGSTGARNVGRILGPAGFIAVFLLDALKAVVALWVVMHLLKSSEFHELVLPAVVAGHIWPVQLGFKGGRGIAPALGGLLYLDPLLLIAPAIAALILAAVTRRFSQSLAIAFLAIPFGALFLHRSEAMVEATGLTALLVLFAHRAYLPSALLKSSAAVEPRPGS